MPDFSSFLSGGGDMARRIRAHDWSQTPLGPPASWPATLRTSLGLCLHSSFPTAIYWGPELVLLYNDAWAPIPGPRHPRALGEPARVVWDDIWPVVAPQFQRVIDTREGFATYDQHLPMQRFGGEVEETYWDYSFTPIIDDHGAVVGIFNQGRDNTARVLRERHDAFTLRLGRTLRQSATVHDLLSNALACVAAEFRVGRVGYAEIDRAAGVARIEACHVENGMVDISGTHALSRFGPEVQAALARGSTVVINDISADPRTNGGEALATYQAMGLRAGLTSPMPTHNARVPAIFVHSDSPRNWTDSEIDLVRAATAMLALELGRARAEQTLRNNEQRYRLIFEQAQDIVFTTDPNQVITGCNPAGAAAIGLPVDAIIGRPIGDFVNADELDRTATLLRRALSDGGTVRYDVEVNAADGRVMQWEVNATLAVNSAGMPVGLMAIARDVTERRAFDARQALLINELNHRVKNTLALVQGIALQSFRPNRDLADGRAAFQTRLMALSAAHDLLTREQWEGATLGAVIDEAIRPYAGDEQRFDITGPHVQLSPRAAVSIVMAIHELATNAAKYGALTTPEGRVAISWRREEERLHLEWTETGGPPVCAPSARGFGTRMIERVLATDLGGNSTIDFHPDGVRCAVAMRLPEHAE